MNRLSRCSNCGKLMVLIGLCVCAPLLILPFYPQDGVHAMSFLVPGGLSVAAGVILCLVKKRRDTADGWRTSIRHSSLTVLFAWSWGVLLGAAPFVLSRLLNPVQGAFEAVSGWTTTGLSVMDVSKTPQIFLFYRSFMQYCGGLGFVMMMILLISGKESMELYSAEGHPDRIMPNIKHTAQAIFLVYNVCLVLGTIAYRVAGMSWFDGICHSMCSLSTGGFSTKLNSIGEYHSLSIELITIVLMLIGTTNFAALLLAATGKFRAFFRVSEVRFMVGLLVVFIPTTAFSLMEGLNISYWEGLRKSAFDVVSALSTSGYSTMSYAQWPAFAIGVLILMMLIGGGVGSTAGGIKLSRVYLLLRFALMHLRERICPSNSIQCPTYCKASGKEPIDARLIRETAAFLGAYLVLYTLGTLAMTLTAGCSLTEAMFDFASSLSTVGLSIGITNPATNSPTLIVEILGMMLGRLEIFIVLIGVASGFDCLKDWAKKLRKE